MVVTKPDLFWPYRTEEKVEKIVTLDRKPEFQGTQACNGT